MANGASCLLKNQKWLKSVHFILVSLGPLLNSDLYHLIASVIPRVIHQAQVIIYGNQKHNYLNTIKAEQLMAGKQLLSVNY